MSKVSASDHIYTHANRALRAQYGEGARVRSTSSGDTTILRLRTTFTWEALEGLSELQEVLCADEGRYVSLGETLDWVIKTHQAVRVPSTRA